MGPGMYFLEGPPKAPARCVLPEGKLVVFVDDRDNKLSRVAMRAAIGDAVAETLIDAEAVTSAVSAKDAIAWVRKFDRYDIEDTSATTTPDGAPTTRKSLQAIGRAVGADIVISIKVISFSLSVDGVTPRPHVVAEVKAIDAKAGVRLFPSVGVERVETTIREVSPELYRTSVGRRQIEDEAAAALAEKVAWLFCEHELIPLGQGVRGQDRR